MSEKEENLQPNSEKISNQKSGLSELTNQLQIARARNDAKTVEISRLERQLRILAELQGISVADLRKAPTIHCHLSFQSISSWRMLL